jgi:hypothetical protein
MPEVASLLNTSEVSARDPLRTLYKDTKKN